MASYLKWCALAILMTSSACKLNRSSGLSEYTVEVEDYSTFSKGVETVASQVPQLLTLNDGGNPGYISNTVNKILRIPIAQTPEELALMEYRLLPFSQYLKAFGYYAKKDYSLSQEDALDELTKQESLIKAIWENRESDIQQKLSAWNSDRQRQGKANVLAARYKSTISRRQTWAMFIPEQSQDIWLQFNEQIKDIFVIVLTHDKIAPKAYFSIRSRIATATQDGISNQCYSCHLSGKPFYIDREGTDANQLSALRLLNDKIQSYDHIPTVHSAPPVPEDLPRLGLDDQKDKGYLSVLLNTPLADEEAEALLTLSQCQDCHDGQTQAALYMPFGVYVDLSVQKEHMPPESHSVYQKFANWPLKQKLSAVLIEDYRLKLSAWLLGVGLRNKIPSPGFKQPQPQHPAVYDRDTQ